MNNAPQQTLSNDTSASASALAQAEQSITPVTYTGGTADRQLDAAINAYLNKRGFNYNTADDTTYQQYIQQQRQNAQKGADLSVQTANQLANGYNPTYANAVSSEIRNDYTGNIGDNAAAYKQLAMQENALNDNQLANALNIRATEANKDYSRNRDTVADNKNFLNYLAERYITDRSADIQRDSDNNSVYSTLLSGAVNNLADERDINNRQYQYNTQSADSIAKINADNYENQRKLEYEKAKDAYNKRVAEAKAAAEAQAKAEAEEQKKQEKYADQTIKDNSNRYIKAYNLRKAKYDYQINQVAIGYYKGYINLEEVNYIADKLGIDTDDIADILDNIEKNNGTLKRRYDGGYN